MTTQLKKPVHSDWLKSKLGFETLGTPMTITSIDPLSHAKPHCLTFSSKVPEGISDLAIIAPRETDYSQALLIPSKHPRLDFIRIVTALEQDIGFILDTFSPKIDPTAKIGEHVVIGRGVEIGAGTKIYHNVVIADGVKIGNNCTIKSGAVIGEEGFGFGRDEHGIPMRMPHLGSVIIGDHVEIGALNTVNRGALSNTIIEDHVKTDDNCHIGHNCLIKKRTMVASGTNISGSVIVGEECWISTGSTLKDKVNIGDKAFIGLGAVVIQDVKPCLKVFGNPARAVCPPKQ